MQKVFLFLFFMLCAFAGHVQETKKFTKEFDGVKKLRLVLGSRNLHLATWDQNKIQISIELDRIGIDESEDKILKKSGFSYQASDSELTVRSGIPFSFDNFDVYALGLEIVPGRKFISIDGGNLHYYNGKEFIPLDKALKQVGKYEQFEKLFTKAAITISVPKYTELEIENDFGLVNLQSDISKLTLKGSRIEMQAKNINNLTATLSYVTLHMENVHKLNVQAEGSKLYADSIDMGDIHSTASTIELRTIKQLEIDSKGDEFRLGEANSIKGRKKYGRLYIDKINNSLELDAENTEVRVKAFAPGAKLVDITNKFASLSLPVSALPGYQIQLQGFNIYTSGTPQFSTSERGLQKQKNLQASFGAGPMQMRLNCDQCTISF
jgi:hypothetical protein